MSQDNNDNKLTHIVGRAGGAPKTTDSGKMVVSIAVTLRYGEEDDGTRWVSAWIKDPSLRAFAEDQIDKGSRVAAVGYLNEGQPYKGKRQFNMNVTELGIVEWAKRNRDGNREEKKVAAVSEELSW